MNPGGLYLRLLHEEQELDATKDVAALEALVAEGAARFPGLALSEPITAHFKGGYKLFLDCRLEDREGIVLHFRAAGWLACI